MPATGTGNLENVGASSERSVAADEQHFVETLEMFVPHARDQVAELAQNVLAVAEDEDRATELVGPIRRALRLLAGEFEVLKCFGAARLCSAAEAAIAAANEFPAGLALECVDAVARYVDQLGADYGAQIDDVIGLLEQLRGDDLEPVVCTVGGEFASHRAEFLAAARQQGELLHSAMRGYRDGADQQQLEAARAANRGVGGIAGMLGLQPLVDLAQATESLFAEASAAGCPLGAAEIELVLDGAELAQQLLDGIDGGLMPTVGRVAELVDRLLATAAPSAGSAAAAVEFLTVALDTQEFGIAADRVGQVVGVAELPGEVAMLELRPLLGLPTIEPGAATCVVLVELGEDHDPPQVGLVVDDVRSVVGVTAEQFEDVAGGGLVVGHARVGDRFLQLLDLDSVLAESRSR